jgi:hypothetical protein
MFLHSFIRLKFPAATELEIDQIFSLWCCRDSSIEEILEEYPIMLDLKIENTKKDWYYETMENSDVVFILKKLKLDNNLIQYAEGSFYFKNKLNAARFKLKYS